MPAVMASLLFLLALAPGVLVAAQQDKPSGNIVCYGDGGICDVATQFNRACNNVSTSDLKAYFACSCESGAAAVNQA